jgi:hypothetical protein
MESVYHIVAIRVNETSWAHVWRLRFRYLRTGYDTRGGLFIGEIKGHITMSQLSLTNYPIH